MSFNHEHLEQYLQTINLSEPAKEYVRQASQGLARDVGQSPFPSLTCQLPAPKMGTIINCESRTIEGAYATRLEFDRSVIAYFEQPPMVECMRCTKSGARRPYPYYPDFLVLRADEAIIVQTKDDAHLKARCATVPVDWIRQPEGEYVDLPARAAFESFGLRHVVVSGAQLQKIETANLRTLLRVRERAIAVTDSVRRVCTSFVRNNGIVSLQQIMQELGTGNVEPIYALLLDDSLYTDLTRTPLTQCGSCLISSDRKLLRQDIYEIWLARHCAKTIVSAVDTSATVSQQQVPCEKHLLRALSNRRRIQDGEHSRSARRWRQQLRNTNNKVSGQLEAMLPGWSRCGNTRPKRLPEVLSFCEEFIRTQWASHASPSPSALYREYLLAASERNPQHSPVSNVTFRHRLRALAPSLARKRGGTRSANAAATPSAVEDRAIRAQRPFEVVHCDHYDVDQYCVIRTANGHNYVVRPILTVLRDAATGAILTAYPSLLRPSRRTCAVMLRMCLRRHGRLPETLVVDRGGEFQSVYFSGLMAHCRIELILRPSGHGRFGSEVERTFGQYKEFWLAGRPGNFVRLRNDRAVSKDFKAHARAELTFEQVASELARYVDWFNDRCPNTATSSPLAMLEDGLAAFPFSGITVPDDEAFRIASAVDGGLYRVDPSRGMHIGDYHYWAPELVRINGRKRRVEVRFDPESPYLVYALVEGSWVPCLAANSTTHELIKDPVLKLARSVLVFESHDARRVAKRDAEVALARSIRECEEQGTDQKATPQPANAPSSEPQTSDLFERTRQEQVDSLPIRAW